MKYKVGDEVLVKGEITDVHEGCEKLYFVAYKHGYINWVSEDKIVPMDKTYVDGLNDAWELARKISLAKYGYTNEQIKEIFGVVFAYEALSDFTAEEAIAKIEAYKKSAIKVNSVVRGLSGGLGVVTRTNKDNAYVLWNDGSYGLYKIEELEDTRKTVDVLDEIFGQIGE